MATIPESDGQPAAALPFHGDYFQRLNSIYSGVHGYLAIIFCVIGILLNTINMVVFRQKALRTPISMFLVALAVTDGLLNVFYIPFAWHQYIMKYYATIVEWRSYPWITFVSFNIHLSILFHTMAVWLTVTATIFWCLTLFSHTRTPKYYSFKYAGIAIAAVLISSLFVCIPSYLSVEKKAVTDTQLLEQHQVDDDTILYMIDESYFSRINENIPRIVSFYTFSILGKLVPCLLLTAFSILLLRELLRRKDRQNVQSKDYHESLVKDPSPASMHRTSVRQQLRPASRTGITKVLLALVVVSLLMLLPSGLIALGACVSKEFFQYVYIPLGDIMDMFALFNCSFKFILYFCMIRRFRQILCYPFLPKAVTGSWQRSSSTTMPMIERKELHYVAL